MPKRERGESPPPPPPPYPPPPYSPPPPPPPSDERTDFSRNSRAILNRIEAEATKGIQQCDPEQMISESDFADIIAEVVDTVFSVMEEEERTELNDRDLGFIRERTRKRAKGALPKVERPARRFNKLERVVCFIGGERRWAAGSIQALDEDDPNDPTGQTVLPYVVKIDPPNSRLVSVPKDSSDLVRPEVCFGQRAGANWFSALRSRAPTLGKPGAAPTRWGSTRRLSSSPHVHVPSAPSAPVAAQPSCACRCGRSRAGCASGWASASPSPSRTPRTSSP